MFKKLTDFSYKRNTLEALGFYIAYLIILTVSAFIIGAVLGTATGNEDNFAFGAKIGVIFAIIAILCLSFVVLSKKKLTNNFSYLLLGLLSGVLAYFGGGLLGLIPVAYLTTK